MAAMIVNRWGENQQYVQRTFHRCFLPSIDSFGKVVSDEKIFSNRPIRNKNCLWWPCLLMNRDEMSHLYRGHSINAFYLVSVHLAKPFQRRYFQICQSETIINCGGQCLLIDRDKMCNLQREPAIDASCQVSVHLAEGFQRRRLKCEKLTADGRQVMTKAHIAFGKVSQKSNVTQYCMFLLHIIVI